MKLLSSAAVLILKTTDALQNRLEMCVDLGVRALNLALLKKDFMHVVVGMCSAECSGLLLKCIKHYSNINKSCFFKNTNYR